ncbi:MAG: hypothetical protein LAN71_17770 [Acidobacteriia bacterium]|nr:hypothetical protein [Terriglobia bacterium]
MAQSPRGDSREIAVGFKSDLANTYVPWEGNPSTKAGYVEVKAGVIDINALTTIYNNTKTVPTGTAEAIAGSQVIHSVTVKALSTNTVAVYIGGTGVTTTTGFELLAGESISLDISNLATVFCISGSASQIIRFIAI